MSKNIGKILSGKYSQKFLDHIEKDATDALKTTSKKVIRRTAEATCDLIGKKIANKSIKYSPEIDTQIEEKSIQIPKEKYPSPEKREKIIDEPR